MSDEPEYMEAKHFGPFPPLVPKKMRVTEKVLKRGTKIRRRRPKLSGPTCEFTNIIDTDIAKWYRAKALSLNLAQSDYVEDVLKRHMRQVQDAELRFKTPV
jgi:hypothetical protein